MTLPGVVQVQRPYVPPPPDLTPGWDGMSLTWEVDGEDWPLTDPRSGIVMKGGIEGLLFPEIKHYTEASPAVYGAYWTGFTVDPRTVAWPIRLFHDGSSLEWIAFNAAFTRSLNPATEGVLRCRTAATERTLRLRYSGGLNAALQRDPTFFGWVDYDVRLVANRPLWAGPLVEQRWAAAASGNFFTGDPANPIYISPSATLETAVMENPGDVEAWPVWTLVGPISVESGPTRLGVAGRELLVPFAIPDGQTLVIDTRPDAQWAIDSTGADRTEDLGSWAFTPIERGAAVPLALEMTGNGSVTCSLEPLYFGAF